MIIMKKIIFGIDVDETMMSAFFDGKIVKNFAEKTGKNIQIDDMTDFYFDNIPGLLDIYIDYMDNNFFRLPLFTDVREVLQNLKNQGVQLVIITSREPHYKAKTLEYLENIFGENFFEKILFTSDFSGDDKATLAREANCDVVIDDAPHHIERYMAETHAKIIRMEASWNREIADSDRIVGVKNWREVEKIILQML